MEVSELGLAPEVRTELRKIICASRRVTFAVLPLLLWLAGCSIMNSLPVKGDVNVRIHWAVESGSSQQEAASSTTNRAQHAQAPTKHGKKKPAKSAKKLSKRS